MLYIRESAPLTKDAEFRRHQREQEEQRATMGAAFGIVLLAIVILATLGTAMRKARGASRRHSEGDDSM